MNEFKVIKCKACGTSIIEKNGDSLLKCDYCGRQMHSTTIRKKNKQIIKIFSITLALLLFIGGAVLWLYWQPQ